MMLERDMRPAVIDWCYEQGYSPVCEVLVWSHNADIVAARFAQRTSRKIPELIGLIGIELKLSDVSGVLWQCNQLKKQTNVVYAAMPIERIGKFAPKTFNKFKSTGVGLLSVTTAGKVNIEIPHYAENIQPNEWQRVTLKRKLWRRIQKGDTHVRTKCTCRECNHLKVTM